jgi:hypothetical protein
MLGFMGKLGRPTDFTPEIGAQIVELYAGGKRLDDLCRDYPWAPDSHVTIFRWAERHQVFGQELSRARRFHAESLAMQTMGIIALEKDPQRARVQIQALQWAAAKYAPQTFGDKLEITADYRVNLADAIEQGRGRLLPGRDQLDIDHAESPAIVDVTPNRTTDQISGAAQNAEDDDLPDFMR